MLALRPIFGGNVHGPKQFGDDVMGCIALTHLFDRAREQIFAEEDAGVFCKEAKDQPRHKLIEIMAAFIGRPVGVLFQKPRHRGG